MVFDNKFDNSYARELEAAVVAWQPSPAPAPELVFLNDGLAQELGLDPAGLYSSQGLAVLSGQQVPAGAQPVAQAYAGHQFGGFSPQLGDGRALLLGEVIDTLGQRRDIAFKGSGRTPFSRGGDGKAALGPVLREVLLGEAMHALGIPTTRALAAVATGERVRREALLPGALLTRVAASHLRVGTFEYFAARQDLAGLRRLADYALRRHDPQLLAAGAMDAVGSNDADDRIGRIGRNAPVITDGTAGPAPQPQAEHYLGLLAAVCERQAQLLARWMAVGFIHGVMNTDNMTISGETIDYGPCAFLEAYAPQTVFSSIDTQGRYAFGRQPQMAQWNLARFAEALLPLLAEEAELGLELASPVVMGFQAQFEAHLAAQWRAKLGLAQAQPEDAALVADFLQGLQSAEVDFTLACRSLVPAAQGDTARLRALFAHNAAGANAMDAWLLRWQARRAAQSALLVSHGAGAELAEQGLLQAMRRANPAYIARNHQVELALSAAVESGDMQPFNRLLVVLQAPFDERESDAVYAQPAPLQLTAQYRTYCGT